MERLRGRRSQEIHEIDAFATINAKLDTLMKRIDKLSAHNAQLTPVLVYDFVVKGMNQWIVK